jgi:tRNA(Ile)-lysidine synthase
LEKKVQNDPFIAQTVGFCLSQSIFENGDRILLSLSAGKDSMAMLHLFLAVRDTYNLGIGVFHLNHCLRGDESEKDESFVKEICRRNGINCHSFHYDFSGEESSFETKAREIRYRFIADLCREYKYTLAATAHTKSDNVETILFRIVTGTHIRGLQGIRLKRENIIRPLLWAESDDVLDFLKRSGILWREDLSNSDSGYSRNFIRLKVLPLLRSKFSGSDRNIADIAYAACETGSLILYLLDSFGVKIEKVGGSFVVYSHELLQNHLVFNHIIADLMGHAGIYPSGEKIKEVRKKFGTAKSLCVLYRGKDFEIVKDFRGKNKYIAARRIERRIDSVWSSRIIVNDNSVGIEADAGFTNPFEIKAGIIAFEEFESRKYDPNHIFIDIRDNETIQIRSFTAGDRMKSGGMDRKLKKMMIDNKCSIEDKKKVPIFVSNGEILAAGFGFIQRGSNRVADRSMIGQGSKKILDICRICAEN